jgi:hypothetical protein
MRSTPHLRLLSLALLGLLAGCGGGADLVVTGKGVTVTVDPATVILPPGGTQSFSARVGGSMNHGVTWAVAGGSTSGSFTGATGVYTAPSVPGEYTIVAASAADPSQAGTATALVANPVSVLVDPKATTLKPGQSRTFTASVTGSPNKAVAWSVVESAGGSFTGTTGLYTAPANYGVFTVVARSQADPSRFDSATVTVGDAIRVSVSPNPASLLPGGTVTFAATVTGTSTTAVDWSIDEPSNGCTVDSAGLFTASAAPGLYIVRARSRADQAISGTAQAVVNNISLALDVHEATLDQGQTQLFTPTLTGTPNLSVDWSVLGSSSTAIRQAGPYLFTAPAVPGRYILQAASVANPQARDLAQITVNPVVVSLQPSGGAVVSPGGVVSFTASLTGSVTKSVTWSVLSGGAGGAINSAGVYTAPTAPGTDTVVATATADPTATASALVTVGKVTITPAQPQPLAPGQSAIFSASVTGVADPGVTWSARVGGADLQPNPMTQTGLFTAPVALGVYRIRATSSVNPALFGEVQITVQ